MPIQFLHGAAGKLSQVGIGRHGKETAAGGFGKILQGFGVELADDMFPLCILPEPVFPALIGNGSAGFRADTYGDDQKPAFLCFLRNIEGGIHRIFTIAEDNQCIRPLRCAAFEILHGLTKNSSEIGAAGSGPTTVHLFQGIAQGGVVIGQRND